jgi:hypothetical protein
MKKGILICLIFLSLKIYGQELFFIGEKSFPCTKGYILKSNSDAYYINDLEVKFVKDNGNMMIALSTKTTDVGFSGKLIIYLEDGVVISSSKEALFDYVDKVALAVYYLTNEDLIKLKESNINTIKYSLKNKDGREGPFGGSFSSSNKSKIDFPKIISNFHEE